MKSIYVHVPFCLKKCGYCDFYSVEHNESITHRYLDAVEKEIASYKGLFREIRTVYIGGGTPSVIGEGYLERLFNIIHREIHLSDDYEFTIEVNPATITPGKIAILKANGINRVSVGVQAFSDKLLSLLGRAHNARGSVDAVREITRYFDNFSIDLIYGIPLQDIMLWRDTVINALSFQPSHIAAYELTVEKETPLHHELKRGKIKMPDENLVLTMQETASLLLSEKGLRHYEISNYCVPGRESLHNLNYWSRGEYIGIGPAAHSFLNNIRYKNISDVKRYCQLIEKELAVVDEKITLSLLDALKEMVFLGMRTDRGIDLSDFIHSAEKALNKELKAEVFLNRFHGLFERGLMKIDNGRIRLSEKGFLLSNTLMVEFMHAIGL